MNAARFALVTLLLAGCGGGEGPPTGGGTTDPPKVVRVTAQEVSWNPGNEPVGKVVAVADEGSNVVVFSDKGAITFDHGTVASTDTTQTEWLSATVIPAADHTGKWMVGISKKGAVFRAHPEASLESISGRYDLEGTPVLMCAGAGEHTAFGLDSSVVQDKLAVADGMVVSKYDNIPIFTSLAGAPGRVAMAGANIVMLLDTEAKTMATFSLPGAAFVAFDATGKLFAATATEIYKEADGDTLAFYYELPEAAGTFHGLVTSGERVWIAAGTELGVLDSDTVALTVDLGLSPQTQILGSVSGDIWTLTDGEVRRFTATAIEADGQKVWDDKIGPITSKSCNACHSPGGPAAKFDLTTYEAWVSRRATINQRVVIEQNMPPPGSAPLSDDDRKSIADWIKTGP
jgi:cytochrome c5